MSEKQREGGPRTTQVDRAFSVGYKKQTGHTHLTEFSIGEDGKLKHKDHHDSGQAPRLPPGLAGFVPFTIGDRTFVKAVGDETSKLWYFAVDFLNKEMYLLIDRGVSKGWTPAVSFAPPC